MDNFQFFYLLMEEPRNENDDWRQRYVWHRTSTGQRNKVKVKSLPKDEQWKYAPMEVKLKRQEKVGSKEKIDIPSNPEITKDKKRIFTVYYSADRSNGFDKFEKGKLVIGTDDSSKAMDIEQKGHKVAVAHGVPIDAFKKYFDYEKREWVEFSKDLEDEKKFELISWTDNDVYGIDFFNFKDQIDFQLSDPNAEVKDEESK